MTKADCESRIKAMLAKTDYSGTSGNAVDKVIAKSLTHKSFDYGQFYLWFIKAKVVDKQSPAGFLYKIGCQEIDKGRFDGTGRAEELEKPTINIEPLVHELRDKRKWKWEVDDTAKIDCIENWLFSHGMNIDELRDFNQELVDYLEKSGGTTSANVVSAMLKSKAIRVYKGDPYEINEQALEWAKEAEETYKAMETACNYEKDSKEEI